jgi:hypothetical protein
MAGIFGVDIDFNAYTETFKQYAKDSVAYLAEYKHYFLEQAGAAAAWTRAQLAVGLGYVTRAWRSLTQIFSAENLEYALNLIKRGFVAGYQAVIRLAQTVVDLIAHIPEFLRRCWTSFVWLVARGYEVGHWLMTNGIWLMQQLFQVLNTLIRELGRAIWTGLCNIATHAYEIGKVILQKAFKTAITTIGVIWGISAGLVDLSGNVINALSERLLGMSLMPLTEYAAFGYLQTGLSIALFAFAAYQICRLSYMGIQAVLEAAEAPRAIPENNDYVRNGPAPRGPHLDPAAPAIVRQYGQNNVPNMPNAANNNYAEARRYRH